MKRLIFIFIFNSFFFTVSGNFSDSLENRLKHATSDTAKVMIYHNFVRELLTGQNRDYYQAIQYIQQGSLNQVYQEALQFAQQGLALAEQIQFDKGCAELYRSTGNAYYLLTDYEQAIAHYEKALEICEKLQDFDSMAKNYFNLSNIYRTQRTKIYYSLEILQRALLIWKQLDNIDNMARAYKSIIQVYLDVGEAHYAEMYAEEALNLALEAGNRREEASLYDILGQMNDSEENKQIAEEYYQKSLQIYRELDDQSQIAGNLRRIAAISNNSDTVVALLRKSAAIYEKISPTHTQLYIVYTSLANRFNDENNDDSTKYYMEKALNKAILSGRSLAIASAYYSNGSFFMNHGDVDRAEKDFHKAYDIAIKSKLYDLKSRVLLQLSDISDWKGEYQKAFDYLQMYHEINDSLSKEENKLNVQQLTMRYEFEKAMTENNETINAKLERQQQAMKYQKTVAQLVSIALICVAILLVFIIRSNRSNKRANIKLEQQHGEISRINNELQISHQELSRYKDNLVEMVEEQTEKLRQSELQLHTLSDNLPGGCIYQKQVFCDGKEIVSYISSTAKEWLGINAEDIMDDIEYLYRQIAPEDLEKKRKHEQKSISLLSPYSCEYRMMKGDQEVWLLENAMPRIQANQEIFWDGIVVNITDRKKFEKELINAKEHAEESDRLKSSFLSNMSHEIRTPMNGIVGFLGFIEREDLPAHKRLAYTNVIRSNVQKLLQLIGDIIDISKIDSHSLELYRVPFDLNSLMDELETFFQDFILKNDKKIEMILDRSQFVSPCIIQSDSVRIRQIFKNLIGNAVKFTEIGYVRFGYRLMEHRDQLHFFVEDTGIGIPESKQDQIFERFRKVHEGKTQTLYGGTGLGLPISKNLVELLGGQIGFESKEDAGSTFSFTLPCERL